MLLSTITKPVCLCQEGEQAGHDRFLRFRLRELPQDGSIRLDRPESETDIGNDYVLITLMVDDKTKLPQPITIEEHGKTRKLKTIGDKWSTCSVVSSVQTPNRFTFC